MKLKKMLSVLMTVAMIAAVSIQEAPFVVNSAPVSKATPAEEAAANVLIAKLDAVLVTSGTQITELNGLKAEYEALSADAKTIVTTNRYTKLQEDITLAGLIGNSTTKAIIRDKSKNGFDLDIAAKATATFKRDSALGTLLTGNFLVDNDGAPAKFQQLIGGGDTGTTSTTPFTLEANFNPNNFGEGNDDFNMIMGKGDECGGFRISGNGAHFFVKSGTGWQALESPKLSSGGLSQWHHVAAVYNNTRRGVYVDGQLTNSTGSQSRPIAAQALPLGIGICPEKTDRINRGYIRNVRVYSAALTEEEITGRTYAPSDDKVELWYDFDEFYYPNVTDVVSVTGFRNNAPAGGQTLEAGQEAKVSLVPIPYYATGNVTYSSSNPKISVDNAGRIKGDEVGATATITATYTSNQAIKGTITVTVGKLVGSIQVTEKTKSLILGSTHQITASALPADATVSKELTYVSGNPAIAEVNATGLVTAKAKGTATITITSVGNPSVKETVAITVTIPVSSINLLEEMIEVEVGKSVSAASMFEVLPAEADNKLVNYASANTAIATVSGTGSVSGVLPGETEIIITSRSNGDVTAKLPVRVVQPVNAIVLEKEAIDLKVGETAALGVTVEPENATYPDVYFSSDNEEVVVVDAGGKITAKAVGTAMITVTPDRDRYPDIQATCRVNVAPAVVEVTGLRFKDNRKVIVLDIKGTVTNVAEVQPANATNKQVTYASSAPAVATVDAAGKVTAKATGIAVITATASGKSASYEIHVKPGVASKLKITAKTKKRAVVTWKKVAGASGYIVQTSTNGKKWKNYTKKPTKKVKITLKKLKGKNVFVRVRACKAVGKVTILGNFNKPKSAKVKK